MTVTEETLLNFWGKVEIQPDGCWWWTAGMTDDGYGGWGFRDLETGKQRMMRAHRFSHWAAYGDHEKPERHHLCGVKQCVNPDHLEPVTRKEHMNMTPGTYGYKWANRTHCEKGHALAGDNLLPYALKKGYRKCRECSIEACREWRTANPEKMKASIQNWSDNNRSYKQAMDRERYARKQEAKGETVQRRGRRDYSNDSLNPEQIVDHEL